MAGCASRRSWGTLTLRSLQISRKLLVAATALFMALLAFSPLHVRYSQEARPYRWWVGRYTYRLCLLANSINRHRRYIFLLQIGCFGIFASHIFAVAILARCLFLPSLT